MVGLLHITIFFCLPVPGSPKKADVGCCGTWFSLPWEGIIKLVLTGMGIVVSVVATGPDEQVHLPDGTFKLYERNKFGFKLVIWDVCR